MPRVSKPFKGVPDGESHPRQFDVGDEVHGDLARVAAEEGWLESPALTAIDTAADLVKRQPAILWLIRLWGRLKAAAARLIRS